MDSDEDHDFTPGCECESCREWWRDYVADHAVQDELDERETQP
jgi:hypothetical protein